MVRAKALAIFLGPSGTGLMGIYGSITQLASTIANIGLSSSAVKQIAAANVSNDKDSIGKTLFVFRSLIRITTIIASLVMIIFAPKISELSFGKADYANGVRWMSLVVFFTGISSGQFTLLQGLRRIKDLALARVVGAVLAAFAGVLIIWIFKAKGIIPYLIVASVATICVSWYFAHQVKIKSIKICFKEYKPEALKLLSMGTAFLVSGLVISFTGYYSRILISNQFSVSDVGLYTASWTLSAIYVNFILGAMGADFYPRLTEVINDNNIANRLINEQTDMGITLAFAGILGVIGFSPIFIQVFYSSKFIGAVPMLQWMTIGMTLKIISWPVAYIIVTKGKSGIFIFTELLWGLLFIPLLYLMIKKFGLEGAGIAFFTTYFLYTIVVMLIGKKLSGFMWNKKTAKQIVLLILSVMIVFCITRFMKNPLLLVLNSFVFLGALIYIYIHLSKLLGGNLFEQLIIRLGWKK
jgi:enterobacterial common antigen flippase